MSAAARLETYFPIACNHSLLPALLVLTREDDYGRNTTSENVLAAAREVLAFEQSYLAGARDLDDYLTLLEQHELSLLKELVLRALRESFGSGTSNKEAKRLQLEVSNDNPLAVCFGERVLKPVVAGRVREYVPRGMRSGCGAIFDDNPKVVGAHLFATYCPGCRGDRRHPLRDAANAVKHRAVR